MNKKMRKIFFISEVYRVEKIGNNMKEENERSMRGYRMQVTGDRKQVAGCRSQAGHMIISYLYVGPIRIKFLN